MQHSELENQDALIGAVGGETPGVGAGADPRDRTERKIRCASCGYALTTVGDGIRIRGQHAHTFMNPAGNVIVDCLDDGNGM